MKKRLLSILFCLCVLGALMPALTAPASAATNEVTYIDADGSIKTVTATQITSSSNKLESGWYYVSGNTTIPRLWENSYTTLIVRGDVHIILMDGCTLNVEMASADKAGIEVSVGYQLSIYAQSEGESTGKLIVSTEGDGAAIGGMRGRGAGTINVFGGHITATGTGAGAAIGGGLYGSGKTFNITGGTVIASGGTGAAIGGGLLGHGGTINISGGTVLATGSFGAGIGGGSGGDGGVINISGGTVIAESTDYGAGIGSGGDSVGGLIRISGGTVTAIGSDGAGIGGGSGGCNSAVHISGGTVTAESQRGAGIGGGAFGNGETVIITGGSLVAESMFGDAIGKGRDGISSGTLTNGTANLRRTTVTLSGVTAETEVRSVSGVPYNYGSDGMKTDANGRLYLYLPAGSAVTGMETEDYSYLGSVSAGSTGTLSASLGLASVSLPENGNYLAGQVLELQVTYKSTVNVTGTPYIPLTIGGEEKQAVYTSGSGTPTLVFRYTVQSGDRDPDGIDVGSSIMLNGGSIKAGIADAQRSLGESVHLNNVIVLTEGIIATISAEISSPTRESSFKATITFSEGVTGFTVDDLQITGGSSYSLTKLNDSTYETTVYISISSGSVTVSIPAGAVRSSTGSINSASNQLTIDVDRVNPTITETTPAHGAVNVPLSGSLVIQFSEPMNAAYTPSLMFQGGMFMRSFSGTWSNGNTTYTVPYNGLQHNETYNIAIDSFFTSFRDLAGNGMAYFSISFTTEPQPPFVSPKTLTVTQGRTESFSVTLGQGSARATQATISVGDGSKVSVTPALLTESGTVTVTGLTPGTAEITVSFNNSAETTEKIQVTVNAAAPSWPLGSSLSVSDVTHNALTLTWTAAGGPNEVVGYRIYRGLELIGSVDGDTRSFSVTGLSSSTAYTFLVQAGNAYGLWSSSIIKSVTTEPEPESQSPSVSPNNLAIALGEMESFSVTLGQGSARATQATISVEDDSKVSVTPALLTESGDVTVTGLTPGTAEITVRFNDSAETSVIIQVTVNTVAPSWPEDSKLSVSDVTHNALTLTWTAATDPNEIAEYRIYQDGALIGAVNGSTLSYSVTGLAPSTDYSFQVQAGNEYGLWSMDGPAISATTEPEPESQSPSVSPNNLTIALGEMESFSVTLGQGSTAASQATISVEDDSKISVTPAFLTESGTVTVTGLTPGTAEITVRFNDSAGTSVIIQVTVNTVTPSWPEGSNLIASNVTESALDLTWTAASGPNEIAEYRIYQDGALIDAVNGSTLSYSVTGLAPATAYSFQVQAGNEYGLWSTNGPVVSATTGSPAPSGGSPGGPPGGYPVGSSTEASVIADDGRTETIRVTTSGGSASAELTSAHSELLTEGHSMIVSLPEVAGVTEYSLNLPVFGLSGDGIGGISITTDAGSVRLPSDMLTGTAMASSGMATLTIAAVESDKLPEQALQEGGTRPVISLSLSIDGKRVDWNNPNASVTVDIPYTPTAEELLSPESIVIWYIDGDGHLTCVTNGRYIPETGTVSFTTSHFSYYAVGYNVIRFTDVSDIAWYYDAVTYLAARKITSGTSDAAFSPDATLTRGQFITLLMRAYGIAEDNTPADNFTDAGSTYYTGYLAAAKRLGITSGVGNNKFAPEQAITRQEMFTLLYNALKAIRQLPQGNTGKTLGHFADAEQIDTWAKEAMTLLVKTGIVGGNAGRLNPTSTATRAEMAQLLYKLLSK